MIGRTVCRKHGGTSAVAGPTHHSYKHGRYSKYMPERLREAYLRAAEDPELLHHRHDVALVDGLLADTIAKLDTQESGVRWQAVQRSLKKFVKARGTGDEPGAFTELESAILAGANNYDTQEEIGRLLDRRERLAASERKREIELGAVVTAEQVVALMGLMLDAIKRTVPDTATQQKIGAEFAKLQAIEVKR